MNERKVPVHTVPKMEVSLILPFMGTTSVSVRNNLVKSFRKIMPFCNIKVIFKTSNRLSSYFKYKDSFPKSLISGVVYKYTCAKCKLSYIGYTARYWEKRLEEHTHISSRTGKRLWVACKSLHLCSTQEKQRGGVVRTRGMTLNSLEVVVGDTCCKWRRVSWFKNGTPNWMEI